ncbi:MAG: iron export ABC transporter permease subunit FetB [Candidatus Neomarinimicrobiota bacterium]|nr:MAG: iron export ABC transporter permease subunit FetB [Candidatus Neomarinimicrobiota bacterium]
MLGQLIIMGYFLSYIFNSNSSLIVLCILISMVVIGSWIALRILNKKRVNLLKYAIISIALGGGINLFIVTQLILQLDPWYKPRFMIPLAGMIFSSAMNGVSLAAERLQAEIDKGIKYDDAKRVAFKASLIPIINSLFAVGLVSLPGMMTGQILSGTSPLTAARYQIMVMCMIFNSVGLASYLFLVLFNPKRVKK